MKEKLYWLGFSVFPGIGPKKFQLLLSTFGSAKKAWEASREDIKNRGINDTLVHRFDLFRKQFSLDAYAEKLAVKKMSYVILEDKEYPKVLQQASNPPFLLYVKGNGALLNADKPIAVVGARNVTPYGREVTRSLTAQLVEKGCTIVSGLAFGVDAIAHKTAIQNHGKTIAVLGCGVDCCTPGSNQHIYDAILDSGGTIISAYPPGTQASRGSFPARNRIIAGLSLGVLVTEGTEESGSLITAQKGKEFGRKIFAVPGPITSSFSKGANKLLQEGAIVVADAEDIVSSLHVDARSVKREKETENLKIPSSRFKSPNLPDEQQILDMLQSGSLHFDQIVRKLHQNAKSTGSLLSMMEIKGMIQNSGGVYSI